MAYFKPKKYTKALPDDPFVKSVNYKFAFRSKILPVSLPVIAVFLLITQVVFPLISFTTQDVTSRPAEASALGYAAGFSEFRFEELQNNNVLGTSDHEEPKNIPEYFYISIPKLNIEDALVQTNPENLSPDEALGRYVGSGLPGEVGNIFIYGHSVLPVFYNPNNYKTIFSTLHKLEAGDEIFVTYNNKKYTYKVEGKRTLDPAEVNPLENIKPAFLNESTMVLMTCSPPGTKIKRLLVDTVRVDL